MIRQQNYIQPSRIYTRAHAHTLFVHHHRGVALHPERQSPLPLPSESTPPGLARRTRTRDGCYCFGGEALLMVVAVDGRAATGTTTTTTTAYSIGRAMRAHNIRTVYREHTLTYIRIKYDEGVLLYKCTRARIYSGSEATRARGHSESALLVRSPAQSPQQLRRPHPPVILFTCTYIHI